MTTTFSPDLAWLDARRDRPLSVAHRGASFYANENTLTAFQRAAELNADFWEVDLRLTADGICIACHDACLGYLGRKDLQVSKCTYIELLKASKEEGRPIPRFEQVIELAKETDSGLYLDVKAVEAAPLILKYLSEHEFSKAVFGTTSPDLCRQLQSDNCPWPVSMLIPPKVDPFEAAEITKADMIHLCWEHAGPRPQDLITLEMLERAQAEGLYLMLWHEERREIISDLLDKPVVGICSDRPEILKPYSQITPLPIDVVCHRGAHGFAPENTIPAIDAAFAAGFSHVEVDVYETADHQLVVIHDYQVDRTTDGSGGIGDMNLEDVRNLDAGSWFDPIYQGIQVPLLEEGIDLAREYGQQLYIELKLVDPEKVLRLVEDRGFLNDCFFWSFDKRYLRTLRELSDKARIMVRRQDYKNLDAALTDFDANLIEIHHSIATGQEMDACRAKGVPVMIAYSGNDANEMERVISLKPDLVNVDYPFLFHRLVCS